MISIIEPSPHDQATAYLAATCYKSDDTRPYLFKTSDYGASWTKITGGIPDDEFTRVIREDPHRRGLLYCGTETGIYVSFDDGGNWQRLEGLPITPVWDLVIHDTDLVAATHGRSFWIVDDLTPLHQFQESVLNESARLFAPRDTVRYRVYGRAFERKSPRYINYKMTGPVTVAYKPTESPSGAKGEDFYDAGKNPPDGVIVHYWLKEPPADPVTLTFLDAQGQEIRSFTSKRPEEPAPQPSPGVSAEAELQAQTAEEEVSSEPEPPPDEGPWVPTAAGMNRFVWDLRYPKLPKLEDRPGRDPRTEMLEAATPPQVTAGRYAVRLSVGGQTSTESFSILPDPRLPVTEAEAAEQFKLKLAIYERLVETHAALNQIVRVRQQVEEWERRAKGRQNPERVEQAGKVFKEQLSGIEAELINLDADKPQPGLAKLKEKLCTLSSMIDESDHAPTQGAREVYAQLSQQLEQQRARLAQVLEEHTRVFGEAVQAAAVPAIVP
jgi:hypothetical protein